jgi:glyoxylase-like metal-dependent hydrolase (beta-lactamase superfamily II)
VVTAIAKDIYRIEVPLPIPVVGSMNCYVIADRERPLVVDPGMAHEMCLDAVTAGLAEIGIDPRESDYFMTHHHLDHFGLVSRLMGDESVIYINPLEALMVEKIASRRILDDATRFLEEIGFPEKGPVKVIAEMLGDEYRARNPWPFRYVDEGDVIEKAGRCFTCIVTAGHSIAHTCLYEPDGKILISGDEVSPVVTFISPEGDPLGNHLSSLSRLRLLDVDVVLPGHRSPFKQCRDTIDQLKTHHEEKVRAVLAVFRESDGTAYEVAARLHCDSAGPDSWEKVALILKFIAARDCLACIRHLVIEGRIAWEDESMRCDLFHRRLSRCGSLALSEIHRKARRNE